MRIDIALEAPDDTDIVPIVDAALDAAVKQFANVDITQFAVVAPRKRVPRKVLRAMRDIVEYNWADERRDYEEAVRSGDLPDPDGNHVFVSLQRVDKWLRKQAEQ